MCARHGLTFLRGERAPMSQSIECEVIFTTKRSLKGEEGPHPACLAQLVERSTGSQPRDESGYVSKELSSVYQYFKTEILYPIPITKAKVRFN
jgi:hypothetical protein